MGQSARGMGIRLAELLSPSATVSHTLPRPTLLGHVGGVASDPRSKAWAALTDPLGLAGATKGQRVSTPSSVRPLAGLVERVGEEAYPEELLLRLHEPAPGIAHLFAMDMGDQVYVSIRLYLYGDQASVVVARDEPLWHAWMNEHFPSDGKGIESSSC